MKRYRFSLFAFYDHSGMAEHFEEMARQGWMIEKQGVCFWRYRPIEPQELKFSMVFFPHPQSNYNGPTRQSLEMQELCAAAGWQLVVDGQMQIYYSADPDAPPLDTDPRLQVHIIHQTMKRAIVPYLAALLYSLLTGIVSLRMLDTMGVAYSFSSPGALTGFLLTGLLLLIAVLEAARYLLWYRRALRRAEQGLETPTPGGRRTRAILLLTMVLLFVRTALAREGGLLLLAGFAVCLLLWGLIRVLADRMRERKWPEQLTMAVPIILLALLVVGRDVAKEKVEDWRRETEKDRLPFYVEDNVTHYYPVDPVPLRLGDLGYEEHPYDATVVISTESILSSYRYCTYDPYDDDRQRPEMRYTLYHIKADWLREPCLADLLGDPAEYAVLDPAPWGADRAWQIETSPGTPARYLLQKGDRLAVFGIQADAFTDAQKAVVGEKLLR